MLYNGWKEFKSFATNLDATELSQALTKLEADILEMRKVKK